MNVDSNQATSYGEYPVSSNTNASSSSIEAFQTSTEGFGQYEANTNVLGLDTQINTGANFQSLENENDFATVNLISSSESSNVQVGEYPTTTSSTDNLDFTSSAQVDTNMNFEENAQVDFGTTNTTSDIDILASSSGAEAQYGEYQASSPIIDTAESAQIVEDNSTETNFNYNANDFQIAEPKIEMENNNFVFTASNSIIGSTSALNNIDSNAFGVSEPINDSSSANYDINNLELTTSIPAVEANENVNINTTMPEPTYENTDLIHELVDPNPIETDVNFSAQQTNINEYQNVGATFDTTANLDMNTFGEAAAVEAIPSFDTTAFASTEQTVDTTPAFDTTAFTQSEPVVDTTPDFDTTACTQCQQAFDTTAFTQSEPVVVTTPASDITAFTQSEPTVDTSPSFDINALSTTEPVVDTTPAFDTTAFTQNEPLVDTTQTVETSEYKTAQFDLTNLQNVESTPVADTGFSVTDLPSLESAQNVDSGFDVAQLESTPVVETQSVENSTPMTDTGFDFANLMASTPE